jgi:hypothetical protein
MEKYFPVEFQKCRGFIRHKTILCSPEFLISNGIEVAIICQCPGQIVLTLSKVVFLIDFLFSNMHMYRAITPAYQVDPLSEKQ